MPIDIECEDCGNKYRVADEKAGGKVRCKECGARIEVPTLDHDLFSEAETPRRSGGKKKRKGGSSSPPTGVIISVGAIAAICVLGIVLFVLMGRGGGAAPHLTQADPAAGLPNSNLANGGLAGAGGTANPAIPATSLPTSSNPPAATSLPSSATPAAATVGTSTAVGLPSSTSPAAQPNSTPGTGLPSSTQVAELPATKTPATTTPASTPAAPATNPPETPQVAKKGGFIGGSGGSEPAQNWKVKVDPAPSEIKIDGTKPITIKLPRGATHTDVVYPATPSVYVALGNNGPIQTIREIWNLATRAKTGTITNNQVTTATIVALSPDGQHLAANVGATGVRVWAAKGNKTLGDLETGATAAGIWFASAQRLVGLTSGTIYVWKIPSGELEHELSIEKGVDKNGIAVSPGGNYLAVVENKATLKLFDLNSGTVAGQANLPFADVFFAGKPDAVAFSPDGAELAMVMPTGVFEMALAVFNVADGALITVIDLAPQSLGYSHKAVWKANQLQWFPDRSKLLWRGHYILDAKLGGPVWTAPEEDGSSGGDRKLLDDKRILATVGGRQNPGLRVAPIPTADIEAGTKTLADAGPPSVNRSRGGAGAATDSGDQVDPNLPKLLTPDLSNFIPVAGTATATWSMKPDPAGAAKTVKTAMPVPPNRPSVGGVFVTRPDIAKALVWYTDDFGTIVGAKGLTRHRTQSLPTGPGTVAVDVFDLTTGKVQSTLPIPYKSAVLDASPDGEFLAVKTTKPNAERIDIFSVQQGKTLGGWRPYRSKDDHFKDVTSALLVDSQYCLTQNQTGVSIMWKFPECKAVWRMEGGSNFCLSPGGQYLGFQHGQRFVFMNPRTGDLAGEVPVMMPNILCAFHPVGTHLALLGSDSACRKVMLVDVAAGKPTAEFYIPHGESSVQWCGDAFLLVDGKWLVDLKKQKNAWTYQLPFGMAAKTQPELRHWFIVGTSIADQNLFLSAATVPEQSNLARIEAGQLPDETLLKPGMQINLQVNLGASSPNHPNLITEVTNNFRTGMTQRGFQVGAGSPYTFVISSTQTNPGGNMEFQKMGRGRFGPGGGVTTVPITDVTCEISLQSNGQAIWKTSSKFSNKTFGITFLSDGEDITTHLAKRLGDSVAGYLKNFPVPAQVFPSTAGAGLGKSTFVPGGTQPGTN